MSKQSKYVMVKPVYKCVRCSATVHRALIKKPRSQFSDTEAVPEGTRNIILHECNETEIGVCQLVGVDIMGDA